MGQFSPRKDLKFISQGKTIPGGQILKFNAFQLIEMNVKNALNEEKHGFNGIMCDVKIVKNKLFAPNLVVNILGDFVRGFSNFWTSYSFLVETGRIKTGAWNFLMNTPEKKFRTKDAENMYEKDEGFKLAFDELVKDAIKIDIVEKHNPNLYED
jgi:hypothetical protein